MNHTRSLPSIFQGRSALAGGCLLLAALSTAHSQTEPTRLDEVVVQAESESEARVQEPFLPDVQGTRILAGKKQSVIDLDELPRVNNNN
jgi:hypothetical protein